MRGGKEEEAALLAPREPVGKQEEGVFLPSFCPFVVSIHRVQMTKGRVAPLCFPSLFQGKIAIVVFLQGMLTICVKHPLGRFHTQVRGTGQVGEMSDLIVQTFVQAEARARALRGDPVLLLLDEADALAVSRETQQMHHEDKAGLNTLLQRLDNLRLTRLPIAALFITNRPDALDPAVRYRSQCILGSSWFLVKRWEKLSLLLSSRPLTLGVV